MQLLRKETSLSSTGKDYERAIKTGFVVGFKNSGVGREGAAGAKTLAKVILTTQHTVQFTWSTGCL